MNFKQIEKLLLSKHSIIKKNGIEFLYPVLEKLGNPHKKLGTVIHVTGTNGKGSVCALSESILRHCGYSSALYTSPHIFSLKERIKFNGKEISEEDFVRIFKKVYPLCGNLTFFEILTIISFCYFAEKKPDFSVIEVGIGGLYDTTNVLEKTDICFITSIDLDHKDVLGPTKKHVAFQKAGIIKENSVCFYPNLSANLEAIIQKKAKSLKARCQKVKDVFKIDAVSFKDNSMKVSSKKYGRFKCSIVGKAQTINLSLIMAAFDELKKRYKKINISGIKKGISEVKINARFQIKVKKTKFEEKVFVIDGAHNTEAFKMLIETCKDIGFKPDCLLFSMLSSKDYKSVITDMSKYFKKVIFTRTNSIKAIEPFVLADEFFAHNRNASVEVLSDLKTAFYSVMVSSEKILVAGSFYLAAEVLRLIEEEK